VTDTPPPNSLGRVAIPQELYDALNDCVRAFQGCSAALEAERAETKALRDELKKTNQRLDEIRAIALRVERKVDACDAGVKSLSEQSDTDYGQIRDLVLKNASQLDDVARRHDGTHELAASAYDMIESLSRKLRAAGIINGDETRQEHRSGAGPG